MVKQTNKQNIYTSENGQVQEQEWNWVKKQQCPKKKNWKPFKKSWEELFKNILKITMKTGSLETKYKEVMGAQLLLCNAVD